MKRISDTAQSESRPRLDRPTLAGWLPKLVSLGMLIAGLAIWVWSPSNPIPPPGHAGREYHQPGFPKARSGSLLTVRKTFDLGFTSFEAVPYPCLENYDCPTYFAVHRFDRLQSIKTIRCCGYAIKIVGRVWLIEARRREFGVYFDLIQSE